jgi:hypothetical protein
MRCNETVHQLLIDFKKAYDSERRAVLYNTLIEFEGLIELGKLVNVCLN